MPNTYIKPERRVAIALAALHQRSKLIGLVTPYDGRNFIGARNDTLYYDLPGITKARDYEWRSRTAPIEYDEIYKTSLPITLGGHLYSGNKFTDEEETMDLTSYQDEILLPQMQAVVDRLDGKILSKLTGYSNFKTDNLVIDVTSDTDGSLALRKALAIKSQADADGVPDKRILVAGADAFNYFVSSGAVVAYDPGQALTAFRQGVFGRIAGFDILDATGVIADDEFFLLNPSWLIFGNAAPVVPQGAAWGARQSFGGVSLRVIRDYDPNYLSDRSVVNTFYGLSPVEDEYARYASDSAAAAAGDGSEKGDVIIVDGKPTFTGSNIRGLHGSIVGFAS